MTSASERGAEIRLASLPKMAVCTVGHPKDGIKRLFQPDREDGTSSGRGGLTFFKNRRSDAPNCRKFCCASLRLTLLAPPSYS